jgi:SEC-C motif
LARKEARGGNVLNVPQRVNADDLLFASVRARYLDPPQDVASDLQHAADHPERLDGVTPYQALAEAGELLTVAGHHEQAVSVLRRAVAAAQQSHDSAARIALAAALARAGGSDDTRAPASGPIASHRLARLAQQRRRETFLGQAPHGSGHPRGQRSFRQAGPGGPGPHLFPARAGDAVLWWPDTQYQRLMRQLPELAPALGWPWPQHIANTEKVLRLIGAAGRGTAWLIAAEFTGFVGYLKQAPTDPRAAETLRGYAAHAVVTGTPVPWPPRSRKPCWCGSDRRYKDCCGAS